MIGSHNTFSYMRPKQWWAWLLIPTARCQKNDIQKQIGRGINLLDVRLRHDKKLGWCVCHGLTIYCPVAEAFAVAREYNLPMRILVEGYYDWDNLRELDILQTYYNVKVCEYRDKETWKPLGYSIDSLPLAQYVGSVQSWYGKMFPFLYTWLNKKKIRKEIERYGQDGTNFALFDFI